MSKIASWLSLTLPSILLMLAACGYDGSGPIQNTHDACRPLTIFPDPRSTADQKASMEDAIQMWNSLGVTKLSLDPTPGAPVLPIRFEDAPPAFLGLYEDKIGEIVINTVINERHARAVTMAHEIGHALGLYHVDPAVRGSVMNAGNYKIVPTEEDNRSLVSLWTDCTSDPAPKP